MTSTAGTRKYPDNKCEKNWLMTKGINSHTESMPKDYPEINSYKYVYNTAY